MESINGKNLNEQINESLLVRSQEPLENTVEETKIPSLESLKQQDIPIDNFSLAKIASLLSSLEFILPTARESFIRLFFNTIFAEKLEKHNIHDFESCGEFLKNKILNRTNAKLQNNVAIFDNLANTLKQAKDTFLTLTANQEPVISLLTESIGKALETDLTKAFFNVPLSWIKGDKAEGLLDLLKKEHQVTLCVLVATGDENKVSYAEFSSFGLLNRKKEEINLSTVNFFAIVEEIMTE